MPQAAVGAGAAGPESALSGAVTSGVISQSSERNGEVEWEHSDGPVSPVSFVSMAEKALFVTFWGSSCRMRVSLHYAH